VTEKLSTGRLKKIEEFFRNPPPYSKSDRAREFDVDLSLLDDEAISINIRKLSQIEKVKLKLNAVQFTR
jgi:hypothetical protein